MDSLNNCANDDKKSSKENNANMSSVQSPGQTSDDVVSSVTKEDCFPVNVEGDSGLSENVLPENVKVPQHDLASCDIISEPSCSKSNSVLMFNDNIEQAADIASSAGLKDRELDTSRTVHSEGDRIPLHPNITPLEPISTGDEAVCESGVNIICKKSIPNSHNKTIVTRPISYPKRFSPVKRKRTVTRTYTKKQKIHLSEAEADKILEGMSDIDDILEGSALKNNLTAVNVKNILKSVITSPDVLNYVWNKMHQNIQGNTSLAALYEPKLTRSTVRRLCEGSGSVQTNFDDQEAEDGTVKLLGKELPDNESSDEEYDPQKDPELSEDEDTSIITSDIGSPAFSNTSCLTPAICEEDDSKEASTTLDEFPELVIAEEDIIAQRTRSRLPLVDTPLEHLEAAFIAPDITTDMYDSDCGDDDWKEFLSDMYKHRPDPVVEVEDDNDDPEYNFFEEEDITDEWDFRSDRAVKISKKELNDLVAELMEATEGCDGEMAEADVPEDDEEEMDDIASHEKLPVYVEIPESATICEMAASSPPSLINAECRALLDQHMRMHIQLLSQLFLLSSQDSELIAYQNGAKSLICEIKCLSRKTFPDGTLSAFQAHNLDEAVNLVSSEKHANQMTASPGKKLHTMKYAKVLIRPLPKTIQETIAHSSIFIYPHLLPIRLLYHPWNSKKVFFIPAEDELIALGLEQFIPLHKQFPPARLIQSLLMTCKTEQQIRVRIGNIRKRVKTEGSNPINYFKKHGHAPPTKTLVFPFNPKSVVPPIKIPNLTNPQWLANLKIRERGHIPISPILIPSFNKTEEQPLVLTPKNRFRTGKFRSSRKKEILPKSSTPKRRYNFILPRLSPTSIYMSVKNVSPYKQISPILKKYGHHRIFFRCALSFSPKKQAKAGRRPIAPKASTIQLTQVVRNLEPMYSGEPVISIPSPPGTPETIIPSPIHELEEQVQDTMKTENPPTFVEEEIPSASLNIEMAEDQPDNGAVTLNSPEQTVHIDPSNDGGSQSEIDTCEEEEEIQDNEGDLAALMTASSTIFKNPLQLPKRTRQQKELESTLALLGPDLPTEEPLRETRDTAFAHAYIRRVKDVLVNDQETFYAFLQLLLHFRDQPKVDPVQLFQDVSETLHCYPDLIREFVPFLLPEQAVECNRFSEHFLFEKVLVFWRKLEVHYNRQPRQLKKLRRALLQLQKHGNFSSHALYSSVQPFLRNHAHLLEEFHGLLPKNRPPEILQNDFEEFSLPDSDSEITDFDNYYEEFVLPVTEDLYGTAKCQCVCHQNSTDLRMKNRKRHCTKCGIRFIDGRVFLHVGKVLKPARVTCHFKTTSESPTRQLSSPPITTPSSGITLQTQHFRNLLHSSPSKNINNSSSLIQSIGDIFDTDTNSCSPSKLPPGKDLKARLESGISDLLTFPSQIRQKSESNNPSELSLPLENNAMLPAENSDVTWSKEEDKLLLEMCQQMGTNEHVFKVIHSTLTHRSVKCIQARFWELLQIFTANQKSDDEDHSEED